MRKEQFERFIAENFPGVSLQGHFKLGGIWTYNSPMTQSYWNVWRQALKCDRGQA
jgi:hypothetical protein